MGATATDTSGLFRVMNKQVCTALAKMKISPIPFVRLPPWRSTVRDELIPNAPSSWKPPRFSIVRKHSQQAGQLSTQRGQRSGVMPKCHPPVSTGHGPCKSCVQRHSGPVSRPSETQDTGHFVESLQVAGSLDSLGPENSDPVE